MTHNTHSLLCYLLHHCTPPTLHHLAPMCWFWAIVHHISLAKLPLTTARIFKIYTVVKLFTNIFCLIMKTVLREDSCIHKCVTCLYTVLKFIVWLSTLYTVGWVWKGFDNVCVSIVIYWIILIQGFLYCAIYYSYLRIIVNIDRYFFLYTS